MESEFSCKKRHAKCSLKRRWSNCTHSEGSSNFNRKLEWLLFMCILGLKNGILKSNIYVVPRPFQITDMLQIYHGGFCNGNRNSTSQKRISCRLKHRGLITRHICMDNQLKFPRIQMDYGLFMVCAIKCPQNTSKYIFMWWIQILLT